jgi:anti-sigma factor RsiW
MLTGAYVLDALDEFERRQFEAHLAECPDCAQEVAELRATTTRLGLAVAEQPPARLRAEVLDRIAGIRQESPHRHRSSGQRAAAGRQVWLLRLTAAAAVLALLAAVGLGVLVARTDNQLDTARQQLSQAQSVYGPLAEVLSAPDAHAVSGTGVNDVGNATVVVSARLDAGMLMVSGMPATPANHV